jgi:hypothetical protein
MVEVACRGGSGWGLSNVETDEETAVVFLKKMSARTPPVL